MPIYEYQSSGEVGKGCRKCRHPFEVLQGVREESIRTCASCGAAVKKLMSRCRSAVIENSPESGRVERKIKEYESSGMWSHAAELADTHAEKVKDKSLRTRALDNYKKAGYDVDSLAKHDEKSNE